MRNCLNCYYRSWIGLDSAIEKQIKNPHAKCIEHIYYDDKSTEISPTKLDLAQMIKKHTAPRTHSYKITHAGTAMTSFNQDDVELKFCGKCKVFHDDV